jgi:hypothetical protein
MLSYLKLELWFASLQFLATAVLEANDVIDSIHNSLDEQKQLVAFSIRQQEEVCSICSCLCLGLFCVKILKQ